MENYLLEEVAREMLAKDAALASEFARRLREDPDSAANPAQRLAFFSRPHPAWDEQLNLYPVFRVNELEGLRRSGAGQWRRRESLRVAQMIR